MNASPDRWNPALEVGKSLIDSQHRELFNMILELNRRTLNGECGQGLLDALQGMMAYAATHFEDEERMMAQAGWSGLEDHKKLHRDFMSKTDVFTETAREDSSETARNVLNYLLIWLVEHIQKKDRKYFKEFAGK